jgi:carbonic anhydrase
LTPTLRAVLDANERYVMAFTLGTLPRRPARRLAVIACIDARMDPVAAMGLHPGDAHIMRNAGGRVTDDVLRSLTVSCNMLGTGEFVVIHHTDCGMEGGSNEKVRKSLREHGLPDDAETDFLFFDDLDQSVRDDVAAIRACPTLPDAAPVHGLVYDVQTGALRVVEGAGDE